MFRDIKRINRKEKRQSYCIYLIIKCSITVRRIFNFAAIRSTASSLKLYLYFRHRLRRFLLSMKNSFFRQAQIDRDNSS